MRIDALVTDDVDRLVQMLRLLADGNLAVGQLNVAAGAVDVAALDTYRTTYEGYARSLGEKRMMLVVAGVDSGALEPARELARPSGGGGIFQSEEPKSEIQSLMRIPYALFCLK